MMGKTHLMVSTGITLSVLGLADIKITLPIAAITAVSALLPDIDEPNALLLSRTMPHRFLRVLQLALFCIGVLLYFFVQAYAPWNIVLAALVGVVALLPTRSLRNLVMVLIGVGLILLGHTYTPWNFILGSLLIICAVLPHRGLTHTLYGVVGWTALLYFSTPGYGNIFWFAGGFSYLLHLFADSLTNRGIRPLPPLKLRLKFNLMSTGTWTGSIVEGGFILLTFVLVFFVFIRHVTI